MKSLITLIVMVLLTVVMVPLTVVVLHTAVRIEVLNIQAGNYLPRKDRNPDGTLADGKWRVSGENTPRDRMRDVVQTAGLQQYFLAPLLLILSIIVSAMSIRPWARATGMLSGSVAAIAITLMLYRQYFQSLGW
jgi:hypothetical protein